VTAQDRPHVAIRSVVANYSRMAAWLSAMDLQQEAAVATIEAARDWDPARGTLHDHQARRVALRLRDFIARQDRPVTFGIRHKSPVATAVELDDAMPAEPPHIEWRLDLARAAIEVNRILAGRPAAREVLLGERNQSDVARDHGLSRWQVVRETMAAREALRKSRMLREFAEAL
jgi:hypothetical protein